MFRQIAHLGSVPLVPRGQRELVFPVPLLLLRWGLMHLLLLLRVPLRRVPLLGVALGRHPTGRERNGERSVPAFLPIWGRADALETLFPVVSSCRKPSGVWGTLTAVAAAGTLAAAGTSAGRSWGAARRSPGAGSLAACFRARLKPREQGEGRVRVPSRDGARAFANTERASRSCFVTGSAESRVCVSRSRDRSARKEASAPRSRAKACG